MATKKVTTKVTKKPVEEPIETIEQTVVVEKSTEPPIVSINSNLDPDKIHLHDERSE